MLMPPFSSTWHHFLLFLLRALQQYLKEELKLNLQNI